MELLGKPPACTRCHLHLTATNVKVSSKGSKDPLILFVGEAPGRTEDAKGQCFEGKAGRGLDKFIDQANLDPDVCRFTNVVRCIPWNDDLSSFRVPTSSEINSCRPYLEAEILSADPVFVVPLGNSALHALIPKAPNISKARKNRYELEIPSLRLRYQKALKWSSIMGFADHLKQPSTPNDKNMLTYINKAVEYGMKEIGTRLFTVMPTFHPSAATRGNDNIKASIIEDLSYFGQKITGDDGIPYENYEFLGTLDEIRDKLDYIKALYLDGKVPYAVCDLETNGSLSPYHDLNGKVVYLSIAYGHGLVIGIPYDHQDSPFHGDALELRAVSSMLQDFFDVVPIGNQNLKFDLHWLNRINVYPRIASGDPHLSAWTLFNDTLRDKKLESMATQFVGMINHKEEMQAALSDAADEVEDEDGEPRPPNMDDVDLDIVHRYCCADTDSAMRLQAKFDEMMHDQGLLEAHNSICIPAIIPVQRMERDGIRLDSELIKETKKEYEIKLRAYYQKLRDLGYEDDLIDVANEKKAEAAREKGKKPPKPYETFGFEKMKQQLNLTNFAKQVLLFDILGFQPSKWGKTGPSVNKEVVNSFIEECLEYLNTEHDSDGFYSHRFELLETIRDFNSDSKMYSSYIKPIPGHADPNGIVHTNYGIRITKTGRFNCKKPSLHVMPWHAVAKKAFVPHHQHGLIMSVDYSQMELRVLASVTGDDDMLRAFAEGLDIHRTIASIVLNKEPDEILTAERRRIKTIVFGLCYGRGPTSIAAQERISTDDAKKLISKFFKMFPKIAQWVKKQHAYARKHGCIWSPHGFRRVFGPWLEDDERDRRAVNTPIQGAASDIGLIGLIKMSNLLEKIEPIKTTMFGYVHDSLIYSIWPQELYDICVLSKKGMVDLPQKELDWMKAPLKVDYEIGPSWGELSEAKVLPGRVIAFEGCKPDYHDRIMNAFTMWDDPPELLNMEEVEELEDGSELFQSLSATATREARKEIKINSEWRFPPLAFAA